MKNLTERPIWQSLSKHHHDICQEHMRDWFTQETDRFDKFSIKSGEILLDYSRNRVNDETLKLLLALANNVDLRSKINSLFAGDIVNTTENRPALHTSLRNNSDQKIIINNEDITAQIKESQHNLFKFVDAIHYGEWLGATGKPIRHVVNIGIGGSHLGPMMSTNALKDFAVSPLQFHFISSIDPAHISDVFNQIDAESTIFIVSSKSFSTTETIQNAKTALNWLTTQLGAQAASQHIVAVTANINKAVEFGIPPSNIFSYWDWVGGRYSIWTATGLPLMLMIGSKQFRDFLQGAHEIDLHFQQAPFHQNIPVILALLGIWYSNFFHTAAHAIVPYSHRLRYLISYIQQAEMESNGKSVTISGKQVTYNTGSVIFGEEGCNGQHSYHQLLHQGQHLIPVDFILTGNPDNQPDPTHQDMLIASALSQAHALMHGKTVDEAREEIKSRSDMTTDVEMLSQHHAIEGNKPSNIIFLNQLSPKNIGALLAIYEHKIFVQSAIWDINPFDQWGVELGKNNLPKIMEYIANTDTTQSLDVSTAGLIHHFNKLKGQS